MWRWHGDSGDHGEHSQSRGAESGPPGLWTSQGSGERRIWKGISHKLYTTEGFFFYSCLIITNVVKITSSLIRKHKRLGKILVSSWKLSIRIQRCWSSICWGLGLLCRVVDLYSKCVLCCLAISHRGSWTYWFLCAWEGMIWAVCVVDWKTTRAEFQWE